MIKLVDDIKRYINLEEVETISDLNRFRRNYIENGFKPQIIKINKKLAQVMLEQQRVDYSKSIDYFELHNSWENEGILFIWDTWKEINDLKIVNGKIYQKIK